MTAGLVGRIRRPVPVQQPNDVPYVPPTSDAQYLPVPLEGVNVSAIVYDFSCQITVEQLYTNSEEFPLEIKYVFPLAEGAAVVRFEAQFPDDTIRGIVKEKKQAKQEYETAVASGRQAALLEQDKTDTFTCIVGNLKPSERCTIRITTVAEIKMSPDGTIQFVLPMVVAPLYVPRGDVAPAATTAPRTDTKAAAAVLPYRLALNLDLWMPSAIKSVKGTHAVTIDKKSSVNWQVSLAEGSAALDRDLVLNIEQEQPYGSRAVIERFVDKDGTSGWNAKSMAIQTTFCERNMEVKEVMAGDLYCEMLFLVDISGSMAGSAMESTKNCLQIFLRSLPEKAIFNIILFESSYRSLFTQSQELSDDSLNAATTFVAAIRATGGTELLPPLRHIFSQPAREGYPRQVFLLTDGQVSNTQQVIDLTKQNANSARMFTFGLGSSVSRPLVQGLATAGGGEAEFVVENSKIATHVSAQLARALQPAISSISIDWGQGYVASGEGEGSVSAPGGPIASKDGEKKDAIAGGVTNAEIRQCPAILPPIYAGGRVFLYGLIDKDRVEFKDTFEIKLKAHFSNGGYKTISIPVVPGKNSREGSMIHKLAAKQRIKELESSSNDNGRTNGEILYLSLKYQVSSRLTSFVAVSDRAPAPTEPIGTPAKREVTLARTNDDDADGSSAFSFAKHRHGIASSPVQQSQKPGSSISSSTRQRRASPTNRPAVAARSGGGGGGGGNRDQLVLSSSSRGESLDVLEQQSATLATESRKFKKGASSTSSGGLMSSISKFFGGSKGSAAPAKSASLHTTQKAAAPSPNRPTGIAAVASASSSSSISSRSSSPAAAAAIAYDDDEEEAEVGVLASNDSDEDDASSSSDSNGGGNLRRKVAAPQKRREVDKDMAEKKQKKGKKKEFVSSSSLRASAVPSAPPSRSSSSSSAPSAPSAAPAPSSSRVPSSAAPVGGASGGYQGLIQSQKFDGSWLVDVVIQRGGATNTSSDIIAAFNTMLTTLVATITTETKVEHKIVADEVTKETSALAGTLLALAMLERKYPGQRAEWMILMEKARSFLVKRLNRCITPVHDWDTRLAMMISSLATSLAL